LKVPFLEISANLLNAVSIILATRNSVQTWWTGIVGCALFCVLFLNNQLYADSLLQLFFIGTSVRGWYLWAERGDSPPLPVTHAQPSILLGTTALGLVVAAGYGYILHQLTDAFAPFADSLVLVFSIVAQLLLVQRRYESWWFWLVVNAVSVGLLASRGLWITMALYVAFLVNAAVALFKWRRLLKHS
jgi:nicotinamide mononucleotide transporter